MENTSVSSVRLRVAVVLLACMCVAGFATLSGSAERQSRASAREAEAVWRQKGLERLEKFLKEPHSGKHVYSASERARAKEFYERALRTLDETRRLASASPTLVKTGIGGGRGRDECQSCKSDGAQIGEIAAEACEIDPTADCRGIWAFCVCEYMIHHCSPCSEAVNICDLWEREVG